MSVTTEIGPLTPVQICQLRAEFEAVLDFYEDEAPRSVLEIGTASGGSLYHWIKRGASGAVIVTVDLPDPDYESAERFYDEWRAASEIKGVEQIRGNSHDPATISTVARFAPFDWVFIDGCHVYEDAHADYMNYGTMTRPGGVVLLHDIALKRRYEDGREAGVWRLWEEIRATGAWTREFRAGLDTDAYGIGALRVPG